jgi:hypothetical protein
MNIIILDKDPYKCSEYYSDRHVLNYIITYSQFLSTAHWISFFDLEDEEVYFDKLKEMKSYFYSKYPEGSEERPPYGINYLNSPCTNWIMQSKQNYLWLCDLLEGLCKQYTFRYDKTHNCERNVIWFKNNMPIACLDNELTEFYVNVPEAYIHNNDPVSSYRDFYIREKKEKAKYRKNNIPSWFKQ